MAAIASTGATRNITLTSQSGENIAAHIEDRFIDGVGLAQVILDSGEKIGFVEYHKLKGGEYEGLYIDLVHNESRGPKKANFNRNQGYKGVGTALMDTVVAHCGKGESLMLESAWKSHQFYLKRGLVPINDEMPKYGVDIEIFNDAVEDLGYDLEDPSSIDLDYIKLSEEFENSYNKALSILRKEHNLPKDAEITNEFFRANWYWDSDTQPRASQLEYMKKRIDAGRPLRNFGSMNMVMTPEGMEESKKRFAVANS